MARRRAHLTVPASSCPKCKLTEAFEEAEREDCDYERNVARTTEAEYAAEYAEKARKALEASMPPKPLTPDELDGIAAGMAASGVKS